MDFRCYYEEIFDEYECIMKKRISLFIQISDSLASLQNNSVEDESIKMEQETCP